MVKYEVSNMKYDVHHNDLIYPYMTLYIYSQVSSFFLSDYI